MDSLISQSINCPEEAQQLSPAENSWAQRYIANPMAGAVRGFGQAAEMPLKVGARALDSDWLRKAIQQVDEISRIDPNADVESIGYKIGQTVGGTAGGFAQLLPILATGIGSIPAMAAVGAAGAYGEGADTLHTLLGGGQGAAMGALFPFARGLNLPLRLGTMGGTGALVSGLESNWDPASMGIGAGQMMAMGAKGAPKGSTLGQRFKADLLGGFGKPKPTRPTEEDVGISPSKEAATKAGLQTEVAELLPLALKKYVTPQGLDSLQNIEESNVGLGELLMPPHGEPVIRGGVIPALVNPVARGLHKTPGMTIRNALAEALERLPGADTPEFLQGKETLYRALSSTPDELLETMGSIGIPRDLARAQAVVPPYFKGQLFGSPETQGTGGVYSPRTGAVTIESWGGLAPGAEKMPISKYMKEAMQGQDLDPFNPANLTKFQGGAPWGDTGAHEVGHHNFFSRTYDKITPSISKDCFPTVEAAKKYIARGISTLGAMARFQGAKEMGGMNPRLASDLVKDPQKVATWLYLIKVTGDTRTEAYADAFAKFNNPDLQLSDYFANRYGNTSNVMGQRLLGDMRKNGLEKATDKFVNESLEVAIGRATGANVDEPMEFPEQKFTNEEIRKSYKEEKGGKTIAHGKGSKQGSGGLRADTKVEVKAAQEEAPLASVRSKMHPKIDPKTGEVIRTWDFPGEDKGFEPEWGSMENALKGKETSILPKAKKGGAIEEDVGMAPLLDAYRATLYNTPAESPGRKSFYATDPDYVNKLFAIGKDEHGNPEYEESTKMVKTKIDIEDFFDPKNPKHRKMLIDEMVKEGIPITDRAKFDKVLKSGNWVAIEDHMEYAKPDHTMGNHLEDLGFKGALINEDFGGKKYNNLIVFKGYKHGGAIEEDVGMEPNTPFDKDDARANISSLWGALFKARKAGNKGAVERIRLQIIELEKAIKNAPITDSHGNTYGTNNKR